MYIDVSLVEYLMYLKSIQNGYLTSDGQFLGFYALTGDLNAVYC